MANLKASYISVLNHRKSFETTFTTESNERNQITYLHPYHPKFSLINNLTFVYYLSVFDERICKPIEILTNFLL